MHVEVIVGQESVLAAMVLGAAGAGCEYRHIGSRLRQVKAFAHQLCFLQLAAPLQAFDQSVQAPQVVVVLRGADQGIGKAKVVAVYLFGFVDAVLLEQ